LAKKFSLEKKPMPATPDDLFAFLDTLGIAHQTRRHEAAFTVEDARALRGLIPGGHTKNLFLKDKKGKLWLVVADEETPVNLKQLHKRIGSARLSFGKAELMQQVLGVTPGSVTPFALMNDTDGLVSVVLDEIMMRHDPLNFHPLENTATTTISRDDFLKFHAATGHEPQITDVT
jgi:Ala-tRNA(Pro) deacylase